MTKQHSQNTRQAVNTAATLYPPPVPRGEEGEEGAGGYRAFTQKDLHLVLTQFTPHSFFVNPTQDSLVAAKC